MRKLTDKKGRIEREMLKQIDEAEEYELNKMLNPDPVTQAIISHIQSNGSATIEEIIASSPVSHLIEERIEMLYAEGKLKKKGEHYILSGKTHCKNYHKYYE